MWDKYPEIQGELILVEELIKRSIPSKNKLLTEVVSELVDAGGKRLRPALVVLSSKFGKYDREKTLSLGGAIELLHTATLVHDDIIDRAKIRRGRTTVSEKYGVDMAVYTGDYLFAKAVMMISSGISIEKLDVVARAVKTICEGEVDQYRDRYNIDLSIISYLKRISRKTALLFAAACGIGAYIADCPDNIAKSMARFGFCYGMAFQLKDDLNDFMSNAEASGKPVGKDISQGIVTLPVIYAVIKNSNVKRAITQLINEKNDIEEKDVFMITDLIKSNGGIENTKKLLDKYVNRGVEALSRLPENIYKTILSNLINDLKV